MTAPRRWPLDWHPIDTFPIDVTTDGFQLTSREGRLFGWSFVETTGSAAAQVRVIDGGNSGGLEIVNITLSAGQSTRDWLAKPGLRFRSGIYIDIVAGSIQGSIWPLLLTEEEIYLLAGYTE